MASLSISAWNMRSSAPAGPYLQSLCDSNDIIVGAEHRLYENEFHKLQYLFPGFDIYAKSSSDLNDEEMSFKPGHCGVCIVWKKQLSANVRIIKVDSDRICAIQLGNMGRNNSNLYIIGAYLPHRTCQIADFGIHANILEELVDVCQNDGDVVIIGDINCHFGPEYGNRFWGNTTTNALYLSHMMEHRGLYLADSDSAICSGPDYSFNVSGVGTSYVDHCVISRSLIPYITDCRVHDDCLENTSDHLSLAITLKVECLPRRHTAKQNSRICWDKMSCNEINELYTVPITEALDKMGSEIKDTDDLNKAVQSVVTIIQKSSEKLKKSRYSKGLKPYWSEVLRSLTENKKKAWVDWCAVGKRRYGHEYEEYKVAKKEFRRELRKAKVEYEKEEMSKINESQSIDQKYFWTLVNRAKNRKKTINPI